MAKTKEEKREYQRAYMKKYNASEKGKKYNYEHVKKWREAGNRKPEKRNCWKEYREAIINHLVERDGLLCGICGETLLEQSIHIDHINPASLGGAHRLENYRLAHASCNTRDGLRVRNLNKDD